MDPISHFVEYLCQFIPGIKLVEKKQSLLMKLLGKLLFFNKRFMTHTTTVLGKTIYLPSQVSRDLSLMSIIAHEYVHIQDAKRMGFIKFALQYTFPQNLTLLALFTLLTPWEPSFIGFLIFIEALFPWPSFYRIEIEMRAYSMSLLFELWTKGHTRLKAIDETVDILHGPTYYWPGGNKKLSQFYFKIILEDAQHGILPTGNAFREVWRYLEKEKYVTRSV